MDLYLEVSVSELKPGDKVDTYGGIFFSLKIYIQQIEMLVRV